MNFFESQYDAFKNLDIFTHRVRFVLSSAHGTYHTITALLIIPICHLKGSTLDADQLTDDEYRGTLRSRLKGFVRFDARYLLPFFSRKMTRQVNFNEKIITHIIW